jgi:hypothetical protein
VSPRQTRNLPASVRQQLLTLSRDRTQPFDLILVRYGSERLLYRLSQSHYVDRFLLKVAMLFMPQPGFPMIRCLACLLLASSSNKTSENKSIIIVVVPMMPMARMSVVAPVPVSVRIIVVIVTAIVATIVNGIRIVINGSDHYTEAPPSLRLLRYENGGPKSQRNQKNIFHGINLLSF